MATAPIDLRSDTVTRPTPGMRRAMAEAEVGDDVYGEDPTIRALEVRVAERLGHEAAVFVPSGTQGNQIAIGVQTRPGEEVILEESSHPFHYENGAISALWGAQPRTIVGKRGIFTPAQIRGASRGNDDHLPRSRLLIIENTHNRGGGTVWKPEVFADAVAAARAVGLLVHLDGARLFNAEVAAGVPASTWARQTDSTTVCFSKGLGAPVGSVLAGSSAFIAEARRLRKRLGGGMRQAGFLAAACLYALDHHVARLAEDHENARVLARRLAEIPGVRIELDRVETNMVYADLPVDAPAFVTRLRAAGLRVNSVGPHTIRLVCHLDVDRAACERAADVLRASLESR
ncbi:MAG TPA: GntG family PLP-dependent aldolase [Myxococcaceae bacterium]|nr:GntG family PLP-dependent aldolase [Myxococcaceae bacterium]